MKEEKNTDVFPKGFFWGASTASHQVEGKTHNQWSVWELENARELAQTAHRRLSWLPNWSHIKAEAEDPENYVSGNGVDHYSRYQEDFDLVKQLNMNAFRFGIEWSRLEPEEGKWDGVAIAHYQKYIAELRKRNIEPFMNIWHWTLPTWFTDMGGFEKRANLKYFDRFVQKIADELVDDVQYIITLNEPNVYVTFSYLNGEWPPQKKNFFQMGHVYYNLMLAHKRAYKILKRSKPALQIGVAAQLANIQAKRPHNYIDQATTKIMRYMWNWWYLQRTKRTQDFVGINYYFTDYYMGIGKRKNPSVPLNDLGWYMEPEGVYPLMLRTWARFKKPIFITENGLADATDEYRQWWIEESIVAMERALSEGVDLRGYLHWSLLDNFEWNSGYWPKFGLVEVDRQNGMKRTIRPSAKWFADWLAKNT
jgi:beta-glucosidase